MAIFCCLLPIAADPAAASDDGLFPQQWNLEELGVPEAWSHSSGAGVRIGIVDSGVDAAHPDLKAKIDAMATCVDGECRAGSAPDADGHGTAVAGVAAASTGNGVGIAGVAPDAHLVVAKAIGDDGVGTTADINRAIRWVVDHGARVVNLSLGDPDFEFVSVVGTPLRAGIEYAWSRGVIPVLAAGNYDDASVRGSANYGNLDAVVVGATDRGGRVSSYSTSLGNAKWGVVAPGGDGEGPSSDIRTTDPGDRYGWHAGTSMAAPQVSGALALLLARGLGPTAAVEALLAGADRSADCGQGCKGRVRVGAAVAAAMPSAPGEVAAAPTSSVEEAAVVDPYPAALALALVLVVAAGLVVTCARGMPPSRAGHDRRARPG